MKLISIFTLFITLTGCAAIVEQHKQNMAALCTYDGAYSRGFSDAQKGSTSNASETLSSCDPGIMAKAMQGYNEGFSSKDESSSTETTFGGLFGKLLNEKLNKKSKKHSKSGGNSLFECEIDVFTDTFAEKGSSTAEAIYNTKNKCTASRGDDFFCKKDSKYKCKKLY